MPSYGLSSHGFDRRSNEEALVRLQEMEAHRRKVENERREEVRIRFERRKTATTAKVITIELGRQVTKVEITEYVDKGYEVSAMNETKVLMIHKGEASEILR